MKNNKSILMIVTNDFIQDPRVKKEAIALSEEGFNLHIIAWNRDKKNIIIDSNSYKVYYSNIKSGTGEGLKKIFKLILFWFDCITISKKINYDFVHSHDLDTLPIGYVLSKIKKARLIYDSHESYPDQMEGKLPKIAVSILRKIEKYLIRRCNAIITVGERLAKSLVERGGKNVIVVGNWKDKSDYIFSEKEIRNLRIKYGINDSKLVICYAGGFSKERNILPLIDAIKELKDVSLILAGMGGEKENIEKKISNINNIKYLGEIPSEKIPEITIISDIVYYCLDDKNKNSFYSAPNKLFEALAGGKAMIVKKGLGEVGEIVEKENIGVLINSPSKDEIKDAINRIFNSNCLLACKENSKKLFETKYNWEKSKENLIEVYKDLSLYD